jgi:uncharacterized protein YdeI (YjbR/CyaY-like superfamily)
MPPDVAQAILLAQARADYDERPACQRNDYLRWSRQARTEQTRQRRIAQMVAELRSGGVYMGMAHRPSRKS